MDPGGHKLMRIVDPPPDLIIEVDVTSWSVDRFPIFAAFGAREVWRYDGTRVNIFRLDGGGYVEAESSGILPPLTGHKPRDSLRKAGRSQASSGCSAFG